MTKIRRQTFTNTNHHLISYKRKGKIALAYLKDKKRYPT